MVTLGTDSRLRVSVRSFLPDAAKDVRTETQEGLCIHTSGSLHHSTRAAQETPAPRPASCLLFLVESHHIYHQHLQGQEQNPPAGAAGGKGGPSAPSSPLWAHINSLCCGEHHDNLHILHSFCFTAFSSSLDFVFLVGGLLLKSHTSGAASNSSLFADRKRERKEKKILLQDKLGTEQSESIQETEQH